MKLRTDIASKIARNAWDRKGHLENACAHFRLAFCLIPCLTVVTSAYLKIIVDCAVNNTVRAIAGQHQVSLG